jgi:hypothetical protein
MTEVATEIKKEEPKSAIAGQASALDGLLSPAEEQALQTEISKEITAVTQPATQATATATQSAEVVQPTTTTPVVPVTETNAELLKKSTFLNDITATTPIELKDWDAAAKYVSDNTGIEVKTFSDIQKVITESKTYKEKVAVLPELQSKVQNFENIWANMPDDLHKANMAWLKKEDYRAVLKKELSETIDITIPFEKQDKKTLLDFFYPGKFSSEDYEEEDRKDVEFAYNSVKEKEFPSYVKSIGESRENYRKKLNDQETAQQEMLKSSAQESYSALTKNMNLAEPNKQAIAKVMEGGYSSVAALFFTTDGKWKPDAAEKLNYLLHAKADLELAKKIIKNQVQSATNENIVTRMADHPTVSNTTNTANLTPEQIAFQEIEKRAS